MIVRLVMAAVVFLAGGVGASLAQEGATVTLNPDPGGAGRAPLAPEEVAVVAARGSRQSEELARYYIEARGLPAENLCLVDMPRGEVCQREQWTWAIRPEIRKWLDEHDPQHKLRCLVTVWDVPLKIGPAEMDAERHRYRNFLEAERKNRMELLSQVAKQLDGIAAGYTNPETLEAPADVPAAASGQTSATKTELATKQARIEEALQQAQGRLQQMANGPQKQAAGAQVQQFATLVGGARVLLQGIDRQLQAQPDAPPEMRSQFDLLRGRTGAFAEVRMMLEQFPGGYQRDALQLAALERTGGLLATIEWLDEQLSIVQKNETGASFDSELSLVLWPDDYELLRWQPNYLRASYQNSELRNAFRTLMVARIDGPTYELAKGLIDKAIEVEKTGLVGKAYIDCRGIAKEGDTAPVPPGSYADFDRALLVTAKGLKDMTTLDVEVNTGPELFKAGECPEAALYCGWYSLARYVDAFDWAPGAVGYHLASSEATTLRDANSQAWCKRMIEDGVAATIGPVYEPYLGAFPRPEEFFSRLVVGRSTLVECYYESLPFNSWMMTLIGDPLYRPFGNRGVVRESGQIGSRP